jgi:hypothetical protein
MRLSAMTLHDQSGHLIGAVKPKPDGPGSTDGGTIMDSSEEELSALAEQTKQAQQKVDAARNQTKADLEKAVSDSRSAAEARASELRSSAKAAKGGLSTWWDDQQKGWNDHLAKLRQDLDEKNAEHDASKAEKRAERAEANADFAVKFASAAIDEAEYAVLSALLARRDADELATAGARKS